MTPVLWPQAAQYPVSKHGDSYMWNYYFPPSPSSTPWAPAWAGDGKSIAVAMQGSIWKVDPYSDVIVHEAAHLLHYLKPEHNGLHVRRGQERFVDVEFRHRELFAFASEAYSRVMRHRERKPRISFAEKMQEDAFSFPRGHIEEVAALVLTAARARNGWRVIREASVIHKIRRHAKTVGL